jgi:predicted porin
VKLFLSYENIKFSDPNTPLPPGALTIGGYVLAYTNNVAYEFHDKTLDVVWGGVKWTVVPQLDLIGAFYGYKQNSYGKVSCSNNSAGTCSGKYSVGSLLADYRLSKRFDVYLGTMYSTGSDGAVGGGYLNTNTLATTAGLRFKF